MIGRLGKRVPFGRPARPQLTVVGGVAVAPAKKVTTRREREKLSVLERFFPTFFGAASISAIELAMLSRQLATFLAAGVPISGALSVIVEETRSRGVRNVMRQILEDVGEGLSMSDSFTRYPGVFSPLYVNLVRAGELTGNLDNVLRQLDVYLTRQHQLKKKIQGALMYPALVFVMALGSVVVLITFVLPRFAQLFSELNTELPVVTRVMLGIASFTTANSEMLMNGSLAFVGFLFLSQRIEAGRHAKDWLFLKLPVFGTLSRYAAVSRFARTLASMLGAGVPVAQSFDIVAQAVGNRVYRKRLIPVRDRLLSGDGFAGPLAESRLFPPMMVQLVRVGEETGALEKFLGEAADYYEMELEYKLAAALSLLEPALMLGVGGVVGFVSLSLVSAIYSITGSLK